MNLLDWQKRWLNTPDKNIVWAETGLGKGVLGAYYASISRQNGVLIVTPSHLVGDWINKIKENEVVPLVMDDGKIKLNEVNIVSYAKLTRYKLNNVKVGLVILDESHRVKNYKSESFKLLNKYISKYNPRVVCLSATIVTKSSIDILPQVYLTNKSIRDSEPNYYKFLEKSAVFNNIYLGSKIVRNPVSVIEPLLKGIMATKVFQVSYDLEGIPKPKYSIKEVITPISIKAVEAVSTFLDSEHLLNNPSFDNIYILNKINNPHSVYLQAVNGFIYKKDSQGEQYAVDCGLIDKVSELKGILKTTKPVVLYFFNAERDALIGIKGVYLYKNDSKKKIDEQIEEFENGDYSMFLANISSIGEGIRFKGTNSIVIFTQQYDYGRILQALGRIMYVGNDKNTLQAYLFKTNYGFSMDIEANLNLKRKLIDGLKGV